MNFKQKIYQILRWTEKYTGTDMVYLAKGGFWWVLGRAGAFIISLAILYAFANWLPKEIYGAYKYVLSIFAILAIFALPGMDTALVRTIAKGAEGMLLKCAKIKFKWALIGSFISLIIASWYLFHQNFNLGISFLILAFFLPLTPTFSLFLAFWQGKERFDLQGKYLILVNLFAALILIPVIFLTNNLILILLTFFLSHTLFNGFFFYLTYKKVANQKTEEETLSYGKHLTLIGSPLLFGNQIDKIILWQILGPVPVAIYSLAQVPILRLQELIPISPLALPKLSQKNIKEIKKPLFKKFLKLFLVFLPLIALIIFLTPYLYKFFFPAYLESIPYFQALTLSLFFLPFSLLGTSLITEMKKGELYFAQFLPLFLKIFLFFLLIPFYKIWGAVLAILISQAVGGGLTLYFFKKI